MNFTETNQTTLLISHDGSDIYDCGTDVPCRTISYTLWNRAKNNDVIEIYSSKAQQPFIVKAPLPLLENITLIGTNGQPSITGKGPFVERHLFSDEVKGSQSTEKHATLENICLINIGFVKVKKPSVHLVIHINNCMISGSKHSHKLSMPVIDSSAMSTTVLIKNSLLYNLSKGLFLNSSNVEFKIEASKVLYEKEANSVRECPKLIIVDRFAHLVFHLNKSKFKRVVLWNLKSTTQGKSKISITNSIFDDERVNSSAHKCSTAMRFHNTTASIKRSHFLNIVNRNGLIFMSSTDAVFKECIFRNIRSYRSLLSIDKNSIAYFYSCLLENNTALGNHGSVYLSKSHGLFQHCTFANNSVTGIYGRGGAISVEAGLVAVLSIMHCFFEHNKAAYSGGAVFSYYTFLVNISQCSFKENHAEYFGGAISSWGHKLLVEHTMFLGNTAEVGGALNTYTQHNMVLGCVFERNMASSRGGAITNSGETLSVSNTKFEDNSARGLKYAKGGAIYTDRDAHLNILSCNFKFNKATLFGGAISLSENILFVATNTNFAQNAANAGTSHGSGGALDVGEQSTLNISSCRFEGNNATFCGGAIMLRKNTLSIINTIFNNNAAAGSKHSFGGAIYSFKQSNIHIAFCNFKKNMATARGGAICHYGSKLSIRNTTFKANAVDGSDFAMGGALFSYKHSIVDIDQCHFQANTATTRGGAISNWGNKTSIVYTTFEYNVAMGAKYTMGGALFTSKQPTLCISWCHFKANRATYRGGAISYWGTNLIVANTAFEHNTALDRKWGSGGALHSANRKSVVDLFRCYFKANKAKAFGGAMISMGKQLSLKKATFLQNTVVSVSSKGGALHAPFPSNVKIHYSAFEGNMAQRAGGALSHIGGNLYIKNSLFKIASYPHSKHYFEGELIFSSGKLILEKVSLQDVDGNNALSSLLIHTGNFRGIAIDSIHVKCSKGKDIAAAIPKQSYQPVDVLVFLTISCSSCPLHTYSIFSGTLGPQLVNQTHINCYNCPFGGNCTNGKIKAAENFWGYSLKDRSNEIRFSSCPFGYCCLGNQCRHYNSCKKGREGTLCGQCKAGLTENIVTSKCLSPKHCRHPLFALIVAIAGIAYVLLFMYLSETAKVFVTLLIPKHILLLMRNFIVKKSVFCLERNKYTKLNIRNTQQQSLEDDVFYQSTECERMQVELIDNEEFPKLGDNDKHDCNFLPGLYKIIIYFYQTCVLFKVYDGAGESHGFAHLVQETIATLFNLRADGIYFPHITWCPFDDLKPIPKLLFKTSFTLYLFLITFVIFIIFKLSALFKNETYCKSQAFYLRFQCCVLRILLISYATITMTCLTLLSCVKLGSVGKVLYLDGSIHCYTWWQYVVIATVCIWVASYPTAIYAASWLLHRNRLSAGRFVLSLLIPFPVIIIWMCNRHTSQKKKMTIEQPRKETVLNENSLGILNVMEGPFRKSLGHDNNNNYRLPWESILTGRRFVLILIKTFVIDLILRLYLMLLFSILFLIHHIYVRPFSSSVLNLFEAVCLLMLTAICALNLLPASIYMNPMSASSYMKSFTDVFRNIETVLMLIFPSIVLICVIILGVVRIFQFIIWLLYKCVILIRSCNDRKMLKVN